MFNPNRVLDHELFLNSFSLYLSGGRLLEKRGLLTFHKLREGSIRVEVSTRTGGFIRKNAYWPFQTNSDFFWGGLVQCPFLVSRIQTRHKKGYEYKLFGELI